MHQLLNGVTQLAGGGNASFAAILQKVLFELEHISYLS
jgi:hypothetical protein